MPLVAYRWAVAAALAAALSCGAHIQTAQAQTAAEFYKGRQLTLVVGYEVGNDYDIGARLLAKYLSKQLPGQPTIVVQNMPQAAALASANFIYVRAPRDGSVLGSISRNLPSQAVMKLPNIEADARRYNWLGGTSFPGRICAVTASAPVQTIEDLFRQEVLVGSVGVGSSTSIVPTVINNVVGTKFHLVEGYRGAGDIILAMQRGEVQAGCMSFGQFRSHDHLFKEGKFKILLRAEESEMAQAPGVPSIFDYAKTEEQRQLMRFIFSSTEFGRPYVFPPDVPKDRVQFMRQAIAKAVNDPDLLAEAGKSKLDMTYRPPEHLEKLVNQLYDTPPELIEKLKSISPNLR
jgi:tripartite-type tricarboxylate transporter receptor subunit TctC